MKDNEFVAFPAKKCNFLFLVIYTFFCYFHSKLNRYHTTMKCNAAYVQLDRINQFNYNKKGQTHFSS